MFASYNPTHEIIKIFESFVKNASLGKPKYIEHVNAVLNEVHQLVQSRSFLFNVNPRNLTVVLYLSENHGEFFRNLNVADLKPIDYDSIYEMLTEYETIDG